MVVGVFPALKLGVLFVKQISKPLAQILVNQAKNHPVFRTYFIIPPAQFYHWAEVKAKMYVMNLGKPTKVAKLNEAMAIELGANLMGEVIIFSMAGACLILEYNRQVAKETKKEEARQAQLQKFIDDIQGLHEAAARQEEETRLLRSVVEELAKKTKHKIPLLEKMESSNKDAGGGGGENDNSSRREKNGSENNVKENDEKSLVQRALVYFENDVKGNNKLS